MGLFTKQVVTENYNGEKSTEEIADTPKIIVFVLVLLFATIALLMAVLPVYGVWRKQQSGRAALAEAEFSKRTKLEEAKTNLESERLNAQAEVERAKGAAEAIKIEGGQLTDNYIKYLWVRNLEHGDNNLIYIPTEAGLPLLEAGKRP